MACDQNGVNKPNPIIQFLQFNLVGILNTLVDFLLYWLLNGLLLVPYMLAQTISYSCGVANSYILNSRWTFKQENRKSAKQLVLFVVVNLVSLGVSLGVMWLCQEAIKIPNLLGISGGVWCKLVATGASVVVNFLGNRLFVFKA